MRTTYSIYMNKYSWEPGIGYYDMMCVWVTSEICSISGLLLHWSWHAG